MSAPAILALDKVLHIEGAWKLGLTAEDGWSESLAVLTPDVLYLLEPTESEPLSPFGRAWRRVQLTEVTELTISSISGAAGAEMLRIGISSIFQGDILLRTPPDAADVSCWAATLERGIAEAKARALGEASDSVAACLGQRLQPLQDLLSLEPRWWEAGPGRAGSRSGRTSPVNFPAALTRRRGAAGSTGVLAMGTVCELDEESGGAARREASAPAYSWRGGGRGAKPKGAALTRRASGPSRPWASEWLRKVHAIGVLQKRRDGLWRVGWAERLLVLWSDGQGSAYLLYYKRFAEQNDELLGELRGVMDLKGATVEVRSFDESDEAADRAAGGAKRAVPKPGAVAGEADGRSRYLRITAAEPPAPEPFYVLPKRLGVIDLRVGGGDGGGAPPPPEELKLWESRLRAAVGQAAHLSKSGHHSLSPVSERLERQEQSGGSAAHRQRGGGTSKGWLLALACLNACLVLARRGSTTVYLFSILAANLLFFFLRAPPTPPPPPPLATPMSERKLSRSERPRAGMVCGEAVALARNGDAREVNVRCGPDYPRNGLKVRYSDRKPPQWETYIYIYIFVYLCTYVYMYTSIYIFTCLCVYTYIYMCEFMCTSFVYIYTYTYIFICMYIFIYVYASIRHGFFFFMPWLGLDVF